VEELTAKHFSEAQRLECDIQRKDQSVRTLPVMNFYRNGDFWIIGQPGKEKQFKNLNGFKYIMYLLQHPEEPVSCILLYHDSEAGERCPPERNRGTHSTGRDLHRDNKLTERLVARLRLNLKNYPIIGRFSSSNNPEDDLIRERSYRTRNSNWNATSNIAHQSSGQEENVRTNVRKGVKKALLKMSDHQDLAVFLNEHTIVTVHGL